MYFFNLFQNKYLLPLSWLKSEATTVASTFLWVKTWISLNYFSCSWVVFKMQSLEATDRKWRQKNTIVLSKLEVSAKQFVSRELSIFCYFYMIFNLFIDMFTLLFNNLLVPTYFIRFFFICNIYHSQTECFTKSRLLRKL